MVRFRVRIRFCKQGDLRFIGHRDLARTLERLFRRAGVSLATTQGFHPKPRISFPSALALGIVGLDEVVEVELGETVPSEDLLARLNAHSVPGLVFRSVEVLAPTARKARIRCSTYRLPVPARRCEDLRRRAAELMASSTWPIERPGKSAMLDLRTSIEDLRVHHDALEMRLRADLQPAAGPRHVLAALGAEDLLEQGAYLTRTGVELC